MTAFYRFPCQIAVVAFSMLLVSVVGDVHAQDEVRLTVQAKIAPRMTIAFQPITEKSAGVLHPAIRDSINSVLAKDLKWSSVFSIIDLRAAVRDSMGRSVTVFSDANGMPDMELLRKLSAQVLVSGEFETKDRQIEITLRLTDVRTRRIITTKGYAAIELTLRRVVHRMADDIVLQMTGERGIAQSRVAFISDRTGAPEVFMADYDGFNVLQLTNDGSRKYSPNWSPDGSKIVYTSYRDGPHEMYVLDLQTGKTSKNSFSRQTTLSPRWSPDGKRLVFGLVVDGISRLFTSRPDGGDLQPLVLSYGISVEPSWSPRCNRVVYMSDRTDDRHLYVINTDGTDDRRITFEGKYNASPAWSPRGDRIAFVAGDTLRTSRGLERIFNIYTCDAEGRNLMKLTGIGGVQGNNENPTWSPDGLQILFSSDRDNNGRYNLYIMNWDGSEVRRIVTQGNNFTPVWGPRP
ncbi:MAG: PD40 domain-containing protein [candidate division Zixibacteria bacterium]|nr:PD40 domain-containing protein [candidate division Zixibacteria bacterium]